MIVEKVSNPSRAGNVAVYARREGDKRSQRVATLDALTVAALRIARGTPWTEALATKAREMSQRAVCLADAGQIAGARMISRQRLVQRLVRKGHPPALAGEVADRLVAAGVVNDEQLAGLVASAQAGAKRGRRAIEAKLRQRGIDRATAAKASARAAKARDAQQDAIDLAVARARRLPASLDLPARRRRLLGYLLRRGHDHETAGRAVRHALRDESQDEHGSP